MNKLIYIIALALIGICNTASADILNLTIDNRGTVALGGTMLIASGTLTCDVPPNSAFSNISLNGSAIQIAVGGKVVSQAFAFSGFGIQCAGAGNPVPFTFQMNSFGGSPFKPGRATVTATANQFSCVFEPFFECFSSVKSVSEKVNLTP